MSPDLPRGNGSTRYERFPSNILNSLSDCQFQVCCVLASSVFGLSQSDIKEKKFIKFSDVKELMAAGFVTDTSLYDRAATFMKLNEDRYTDKEINSIREQAKEIIDPGRNKKNNQPHYQLIPELYNLLTF